MTDHYIIDSKGKTIAILLARLYPTDLDLQRAKAAYEKGCGESVVLKKRSVR